MIVYTTVLGKTKPLFEPACKTRWRLVCFTDQPLRSRRWDIIQVPPQDKPTRECRRLKLLPHVAFPEARISLWIDCSFTLRMPPEKIAARHRGDFAAFVHPRRQRITDEAEAIISSAKGEPAAVRAQLAAYQADGWDTDDNPQQVIHNGGFLLRRHTPATIAHAERWHDEVTRHTLRDQMSIDYAAHKTGLVIDDLPGTVNRNNYAKLHHFIVPPNDY